MTKPQADSFEVAQEKIEMLKELLSGFWTVDLQRAWKCGFDAGRLSVGIVPIVKPTKKRAKARRQELVIGRGTKLCNQCFQIQANCRCRKRAKVHIKEGAK